MQITLILLKKFGVINLSKTQDWINKYNKGFRNEDNFNSGVTLFRDVLEYEVLALNDLTIPIYIFDCFCSGMSVSTRQYYIKKFDFPSLFNVLENIASNNLTVSDLVSLGYSEQLFCFLVQVVRDSSFHAYNGPLYCCWLTTYSACKLYYGNSINCYALPHRYTVVSDLGARGVLYVSTEVINSDKNKLK